jgi:predicted MFS family arabinose efflux permease
VTVLDELGSDARLLFVTRTARLFAYGFLAVVLVLYLAALGFDGAAIGLLLALTLLGDTVISLWLTTHADRIGRRRVLFVGALLMAGAGIVFAATTAYPILVLAATIGVISPSGNEVGPFLAVEQSSLAQTVADERRTTVFAWYNLVGQVAVAVGALAAGFAVQALGQAGLSVAAADRLVVVGYAIVGLAMAAVFSRLSPAVEVPDAARSSLGGRLGLHRSRGVVLRLSALFGLDAFGGGFVLQSLITYWFATRWGVEPAGLGAILFVANLLAAASSLAAARIAARIGLLNTMVATHIPSNVLLILVPLMPSLPLAIAVLFARFSISQMDVPTRQSYTMAVVSPDERSAAAGVTGIARTTGAAISPAIAAPLVASPIAAVAALPFILAGVLKLVYDVSLWSLFRSEKRHR